MEPDRYGERQFLVRRPSRGSKWTATPLSLVWSGNRIVKHSFACSLNMTHGMVNISWQASQSWQWCWPQGSSDRQKKSARSGVLDGGFSIHTDESVPSCTQTCTLYKVYIDTFNYSIPHTQSSTYNLVTGFIYQLGGWAVTCWYTKMIP